MLICSATMVFIVEDRYSLSCTPAECQHRRTMLKVLHLANKENHRLPAANATLQTNSEQEYQAWYWSATEVHVGPSWAPPTESQFLHKTFSAETCNQLSIFNRKTHCCRTDLLLDAKTTSSIPKNIYLPV